MSLRTAIIALLTAVASLVATAAPQQPAAPADTVVDLGLAVRVAAPDSVAVAVDSATNVVTAPNALPRFNPDPVRAVWLSALLPGLGQIYNRRYWKLPIIVGGFVGLGYATGWNNTQYNDYSRGYRDLMDDDPSTRSYMNFFPPNTSEGDLDKSWLQRTLKSRKDFYRRNRDLCIIGMVGLYLVCILDAYVDASLSHFDISQDLSLDVTPAVIPADTRRRTAFGLNWAFNFKAY